MYVVAGQKKQMYYSIGFDMMSASVCKIYRFINALKILLSNPKYQSLDLAVRIHPLTYIVHLLILLRWQSLQSLSTAFCCAIGLRGRFTITLKTSMDSTQSWMVHGASYKNDSDTLVLGWKRFFQENNIMEGDICTFNIIKTTLWHVVITRFRENMNQFCYVSFTLKHLSLLPYDLSTLTISVTSRKPLRDRETGHLVMCKLGQNVP